MKITISFAAIVLLSVIFILLDRDQQGVALPRSNSDPSITKASVDVAVNERAELDSEQTINHTDVMQSNHQSIIDEFNQALRNRSPSQQDRVVTSTFQRISDGDHHIRDMDSQDLDSQDLISVSSQLGGIFLQAPHQFADKYTGDLLDLLKSSELIDATFVNGRHRRSFDYSHQPHSLLVNLSLSYLNQTSNGLIVQLHGFAQQKRSSPKAKEANFILSSGHQGALVLPKRLAQCLRNSGFQAVHVFGDEVEELGATKNAVKDALFANGFNRFLHIEMSLGQRVALKESATLRDRFSQCFTVLVEE